MPEHQSDVWQDDTLQVDDRGHVTGEAHVSGFVDGYDISVSVTSYDYEHHGETRTNHVPHVTVAKDGRIVTEHHAHDSRDAKRAIENAKGTAEYVMERPEQFIDD